MVGNAARIHNTGCPPLQSLAPYYLRRTGFTADQLPVCRDSEPSIRFYQCPIQMAHLDAATRAFHGVLVWGLSSSVLGCGYVALVSTPLVPFREGLFRVQRLVVLYSTTYLT